MSLKQVLKELCPALRRAQYMHVSRADLAEKNWLATERISREEVVLLLNACQPAGYSVSNHDRLPAIKVHTFVVSHTLNEHTDWYLKFYYHPDNPGQGWRVYSVHPEDD